MWSGKLNHLASCRRHVIIITLCFSSLFLPKRVREERVTWKNWKFTLFTPLNLSYEKYKYLKTLHHSVKYDEFFFTPFSAICTELFNQILLCCIWNLFIICNSYHPVVCSTTIIVSLTVCLLICSQTALDSKRCVGFSFVMWIVPSFLLFYFLWKREKLKM